MRKFEQRICIVLVNVIQSVISGVRSKVTEVANFMSCIMKTLCDETRGQKIVNLIK